MYINKYIAYIRFSFKTDLISHFVTLIYYYSTIYRILSLLSMFIQIAINVPYKYYKITLLALTILYS